MLKRLSTTKVALGILALVAVFGMFAGSEEPVVAILRRSFLEPHLQALHIGNSILFNLSVGYLVSLFFWLLVVYLPERRRNSILRDNLRRRYQEFRENTIQILLWEAIGTHDSQLPKDLLDHRKFKEFFDENKSARWYAALNGLQGNKDRINDLLLEMEFLAG